jgi:hypothetical protein
MDRSTITLYRLTGVDPVKLSQRTLLALVTVLLITTPVSALSVYDMILLSRQDFSDEQLISLIDATESAFQLTAEDVARLNDLGVSEPVIQKMLSVTVLTSEGDSDAVVSATPSQALDLISAPAAPAPPRSRFTVRLEVEAGAGSHDHALILLDEMPLMILRDEGDSATVLKRAQLVAEHLDHTSVERGRFSSIVRGDRAVILYEPEEGTVHPVLSVTGADAVAFQRRSNRVDLDAAILAAYWSSLLDDIWSVAFRGEEPQRLSGLHDSDALRLLFDLTVTTGDDLGSAVARMPSEVQHHLEELIHTVPSDFAVAGGAR